MSGFHHDFTSRRAILAGLGVTTATLALPHAAAAQAMGGMAAMGGMTGAAAVSHRLVLAPRKVALKPGAAESELIGLNGQTPGAPIRVMRGQIIELTIENRLPQPTALHLHGYRGANAGEGMPGLGSTPILPGETRSLRIPTPDSGTFLLLPVLPGRVAEQLERGLGAAFIVSDPADPPVDLDQVALLDDIAIWNSGALNGQLAEPFSKRLDGGRFGRLGNTLLVNGQIVPAVVPVRPNARVRLRLGSLANARIMPMKFEGGLQTVMAIDGQACEPFDPLKRTVVMLPGSRYEVMLDMPGEAGQDAAVMVEQGGLHKILIFRTEGSALPPRPPVQMLPRNDLPPSIRLQNAARTEVAISGGLERLPPDPVRALPDEATLEKQFPDAMKMWAINAGFNSGFAGKPVLTVKRGAPVVLALTNRSPWPQVMTIHGHVFRLLHPMDDGWEPYFLDTLHLPPGTTSRVAFDAANPGKWAIRSTIAEHYDAGVFTWFEVLP